MQTIRPIVISLTALFLVACGDPAYISLNDRTVEVQGLSSELEVEENIVEDETDVVVPISLKEKILQNSDVPEVALDIAFDFFDKNHKKIKNQKYMTIFDIGVHSGQRRMFIINLKTAKVSAIHAAHGKKSDLNHDGYAESFSNKSGSNQSSLGFMLAAEEYYGSKGHSMRLDGLEARNSRVRSRAVVVHGANYVNASASKMGRSLGCPAVTYANIDWVVNSLKNGSLFYAYNSDYDS